MLTADSNGSMRARSSAILARPYMAVRIHLIVRNSGSALGLDTLFENFERGFALGHLNQEVISVGSGVASTSSSKRANPNGC